VLQTPPARSIWKEINMPNVPHPGYYVYILARPNGKPFYVGKGQRNRIYAHEGEARTDCRCHKCQVIRKIWRNGGEVQRYKVLTTHDEAEAYAYEVQLIALIGRESLTNINEGGLGSGNFTEAALADIGKASRARWGDPEYRAARLDEIQSRWNDPGYRAKIQAAWDNPDRRKHMSAVSKANWDNPDYRARVAAGSKAKWSDPAIRERMTGKMNAKRREPERRANIAAKTKAQMQDPLRRANLAAKTKAKWQEPGYRERVSAKIKEAKARKRITGEETPE
jgi:hypothetical protein